MSTRQPVHIGQVGVGYWGKNLLRNLLSLPDVQVSMICEVDPEKRTALRTQYPDIPITERFEDIVNSPSIDAVVIATQTPLHFPMAEAALRAGKHVFVEKPLAQTTAEAEKLVELTEHHDRILMVGHLLLYHPAFRYVEDLIRNRQLGDIYYLYSIRVNLGIIRQNENAFDSLAPHDLSLALQFLQSNPISVSAQGQAYLQPGIEDVVFASITFENSQLAHLHTSWLDPHKIRKVTVVGSHKMAVIDDMESAEKVRIYDKGVDRVPTAEHYASYTEAMAIRNGDILIPRISMKEPLRLECEHFINCIRTGRQPRSNVWNGFQVVRMLEAARQSLREHGKAITLSYDV